MAMNLFLTKLLVIHVVYPIHPVSETITCPTSAGCSMQDIHCNASSTDNYCEIECNENASCQGSTVFCASNKDCNIKCSSARSCKEMTIHCPETGGNTCNVDGIGMYSLHNMNLHCYGSVCSTSCNGFGSCANGTFNGYYPESNLNIQCNDTAVDQNVSVPDFACKNIKVYCPPHKDGNTLCSIKGNIGNVLRNITHTALNIYAVNSWNDIDLSGYQTNIELKTSLMHCDVNFSNMCSIHIMENTNQWNCINKSSVCWVDYEPTEDKEDADYALPIGLSIAAFFLLIIALCIGLYLKKDEDLFAAEEQEERQLKSPSDSEESDKKYDIEEEETDLKEYKKMMQLVFYTFAGYQPWAKKRQIYMKKKELQIFLDIVNIHDPAEEVLKLIDTDIEDGRLTLNEWMDYFVDKDINPNIFHIKKHIESQITWSLLCKALNIFAIIDTNHTGKLEYSEFVQFGSLIGLDEKETELLWNALDTDNSGAIDIVELFEWFRLRLYQQRGRIESLKQPSLVCSRSDIADFQDFRSAKMLSIHHDKNDPI